MNKIFDLFSGNNQEKTSQTDGTVRRTQSSESTFSIGNVQTQEVTGSRLTPMIAPPIPGLRVYDNCCYAIYCPTHNRMAVSQELKINAIFFPFIQLANSRTWKEAARDGANLILSDGFEPKFLKLKANPPFSGSHCMEVFRIQLPQTQKFITRLICLIKLNSNNKHFKCCETTKRIQWLPLNDLTSAKVENLWGPEVTQFAKRICGPLIQNINEYSLDQAFYYVPRDPPHNAEEQMLKSANITEKDIERLYGDFVEHNFPSFHLSLTSFKDYLSKYGFERSDSRLRLLFNAFDFHNNGFLSFPELLLGLAAIEPIAKHAESRVKLVFKYFDVDRDGFLNESEFTKMCREIYPKDDESTLQTKVKQHIKVIGVNKNRIAFADFYRAVGAKKFRGTSNLCRSSKAIFSQISRSMASRTLKRVVDKQGFGSMMNDSKYKGVCMSCREKNYEYALHSAKLGLDGRVCDFRIVPEVQLLLNKASKTDTKLSSQQKYSTEVVFNPKSVANYFLKQIRAFNSQKGTFQNYKGLLTATQEREGFVQQLEILCKEMEKIVSQEERCVKVSSPAFVIGDIHGNLEDLMTLEKVLFKSVPIVAANYVFLGDYVDRGKWGLECSIFIFALKLLAPNKFLILRGNHEIRELQLKYSYKKECIVKYGDTLGKKVWEITNRVFDRLPLCAIIDDAIYCAHGGIPASTRDIQKVNSSVKVELKDPERESPMAWEILWSDPTDSQQFKEFADLQRVQVESTGGFLQNFKRGTAFFFGEEAANNFLQNNGLTHIIRAHEVPANGYRFNFDNKCTTVFSCSHYCGATNECACVYVDNQKLRIVKIDTVNNAPATDPK